RRCSRTRRWRRLPWSARPTRSTARSCGPSSPRARARAWTRGRSSPGARPASRISSARCVSRSWPRCRRGRPASCSRRRCAPSPAPVLDIGSPFSLSRLASAVKPLAHSAAATASPPLPPAIEEDLVRVEARLDAELRAREERLHAIATHLVQAGDKRIRPLVVLLVYYASAGERPLARRDDAIEAAVALELIHSATLLHDDIIDRGETRRGRPSAVSTFGVADTLVAGDFLFSRAFALCAAFQVSDDLLDVEGQPAVTGKPRGIDLRDGNPSLPIVLALAHDAELAHLFSSERLVAADIEAGLGRIRRTGVLAAVGERARAHIDAALGGLAELPDSPYRSALFAL